MMQLPPGAIQDPEPLSQVVHNVGYATWEINAHEGMQNF